MKIFAIDPGNIQSAYCVMDGDYNLIEFGKDVNAAVGTKMLSWIERPYVEIDAVILERVASYGMPVGREVFDTCEWIGRFAQKAEQWTRTDFIYRQDEKLYICHDSRAKDTNIRAALIERFAKHDFKNGKGTKNNPDYFYGVSADCWAAIAVAVTWLDMQKEKSMKGNKQC